MLQSLCNGAGQSGDAFHREADGLHPSGTLFCGSAGRCGKTVFSTPRGETLSWEGEKLTQRFDLPEGISVYGLGQSSVADLRGWERRMWHQRKRRYSLPDDFPGLRYAAEFLLGQPLCAGRRGNRAENHRCNTADPWGEEPSGEGHPLRGAITLEGGDMDLFLIHGPDYPSILRGYGDLVGSPPVIPRWALGYMQSKFGYRNQEEALEVANEMRRRGIPGDVLIIDLDWFRYFADLNWVRPDPEGMLRQLRSMGFRAMIVSEPFVDTRSQNSEG